MPERALWAAQAWIDGRWRQRVRLDIGADGCWQSITPDVNAPEDAETA